MRLKLELPENISEISLKQFIKYDELNEREMDYINYAKRKINIFTGIPFNQIGSINNSDALRVLEQIDKALATDVVFVPTFTMHDIEFGFIPNFDKITFDENRAMMEYGVNKDTLHKLMAVLFRPIIKKDGDKYDIMPFDESEQYAEFMKEMPLNIVNGALVFFCNLAKELQQATQRYLTEELAREMKLKDISKISDGIQRIKKWLTTIFLKSKQLEN